MSFVRWEILIRIRPLFALSEILQQQQQQLWSSMHLVCGTDAAPSVPEQR